MTSAYQSRTDAQLREEYTAVKSHYDALQAKDLHLNMARGKPGKEQLDLVSGILNVLTDPDDCLCDGIDARNYGELSGLPSAKAYWADILGCKPAECFIGGNASLALMYAVVSLGYTNGLLHSQTPWCKLPSVKWLCPSPGYDRHFTITESLGFELITIPMTPTGPDMDCVEQAIRDPAVKGMWCVPKYSNPDGIIYSDETLRRIAAMQPAAPDFALMWDNAYCIHEFDGDFVPFADILTLCREAGNADMVYEFASTSKVTLPGAGFSVLATSEANLAHLLPLIGVQTISYDKLNALRHVRFLQDKAHTLALMRQHAALLKPKFQCVLTCLAPLADLGLASWQTPKGGYFISVDTAPGLARRTLALCKQAGVVMTPAGATFPYGRDPEDRNIRIAPSLPPVDELSQAMDVFCTSVRLAALEQLLHLA